MEKNRDIINKMSNEEFAEKFNTRGQNCEVCYYYDRKNIFCNSDGRSKGNDCMEGFIKWLYQEAPKEGIYHKSDLKHVPISIMEDKTWYVHRTSTRLQREIYIFVAAELYDNNNRKYKRYLHITDEISGDKFERSYFTKSDAIAIRDMFNEKRKGERYLWVVSNKVDYDNLNLVSCSKKTHDEMHSALI